MSPVIVVSHPAVPSYPGSVAVRKILDGCVVLSCAASPAFSRDVDIAGSIHHCGMGRIPGTSRAVVSFHPGRLSVGIVFDGDVIVACHRPAVALPGDNDVAGIIHGHGIDPVSRVS